MESEIKINILPSQSYALFILREIESQSIAIEPIHSDQEYLRECQEKDMPVPPFDRYIYVLPQYVVKKRLVFQGETGFDGYIPDFATLTTRDTNELKALEIVREYTNIPVTRVMH